MLFIGPFRTLVVIDEKGADPAQVPVAWNVACTSLTSTARNIATNWSTRFPCLVRALAIRDNLFYPLSSIDLHLTNDIYAPYV